MISSGKRRHSAMYFHDPSCVLIETYSTSFLHRPARRPSPLKCASQVHRHRRYDTNNRYTNCLPRVAFIRRTGARSGDEISFIGQIIRGIDVEFDVSTKGIGNRTIGLSGFQKQSKTATFRRFRLFKNSGSFALFRNSSI